MTMLDRMRRHRGWLKWSLGLVAVTMVIFFIPQDYLRPSTTVGAAPTETIAEVEGHSLTAGDFRQRYHGVVVYRRIVRSGMDVRCRQWNRYVPHVGVTAGPWRAATPVAC